MSAAPARDLAVVTGAGSPHGIGRQVCRRLAADGFAIALCDLDQAEVEAAARELRDEFGVPAAGFVADIADELSVQRFRDEVEARFGPARVLVNNAGVNRSGGIAELSLAEWELVMRVNATGPFLVTRAFLPGMRGLDWGRVVFVSSIAATRGGGFFLGSSHYAASKAAVLGFARALAREVGPDGVTVNAIAPGYIETPMTAAGDADARRGPMLDRTPVGRLGRPDDVASLVSYLAGPAAGFLTGATLDVNGGSHIR